MTERSVGGFSFLTAMALLTVIIQLIFRIFSVFPMSKQECKKDKIQNFVFAVYLGIQSETILKRPNFQRGAAQPFLEVKLPLMFFTFMTLVTHL